MTTATATRKISKADKSELLRALRTIDIDELSSDCVARIDWAMLSLCIGFPHCKDTPDRVPLGPVTAEVVAREILRVEFDLTDCDEHTIGEAYFEGSHDDDLFAACVRAIGSDFETYVSGDEELECILAVCRTYDVHPVDCECNSSGAYGYGCTVEADGAEYSVMTDDDADLAVDDCLESYLDDGGIVEGVDSPYFDRDAWKRDAGYDGRGHYLSCYDGSEDEENINGTYYAIFRTN